MEVQKIKYSKCPRCKQHGIIVICILFSLVLSACSTFDGYYFDLEDARNEKKHYEDSDYVFTVESDDAIIDFIIKGQIIYIVVIDCKEQDNKPKYQVKTVSSFSIEEKVHLFDESNDYEWTSSSKLSIKEYSWCIVSEEFYEV